MKKVGKIIGDVLVAIVMVFAILMTVLVITSTKSETGLPSLMGKAVFNVETDSMDGEDGFPQGSLIIVELLDEKGIDQLKVGDVITFWRVFNDTQYLDTHRIVDGTEWATIPDEVKDGVWTHGGTRLYVTRGDNTPDIDFLSDASGPEYATVNNIVGKWTGVAIPKLGDIMKFLRSQFGFLICVVVPVALFFIYELYSFIATLMEGKKAKNLAAVADAEEEIKKKAIAEFMAQQQAQSGGDEKQTEPEKEQAPPDEKKDKKKDKKDEKSDKQEESEAPAEKEEAEEDKNEAASDSDTPEEEKPEEAEKEKTDAAAPSISAEEEEELKRKAVEEYLAKQAAEKAAAEEEIKRKAVEEYLASQKDKE